MERFVILTLKWLYEKRHKVIIFLVYIIALALLLNQYLYSSFVLFFLICLKEIQPIRKKIIKIIKSSFMMKFYNIFIWFSSYLISLKTLSYSTGISEDKLKYAPVIMAIPVSIMLTYMLIVLVSTFFCLSIIFLDSLSLFMVATLRNKFIESEYYFFSKKFYFLIILLYPLLMATGYISPYFIKLALLADSTFISDCGDKKINKTYMRIDSKSCLLFNLNNSFFTEEPKKIPSEKV